MPADVRREKHTIHKMTERAAMSVDDDWEKENSSHPRMLTSTVNHILFGWQECPSRAIYVSVRCNFRCNFRSPLSLPYGPVHGLLNG